ncbi:MAG TPA: hypothetical protein ENN33_10600 [Ignavibacteria bacterium]|nr:hypothetical protein [Ignavibacteria bacterium]
MKYILALLIIYSIIIGQTQPAKKDSLQTSKKTSQELNEDLRNEINELKKLRESLQQKLQNELRELYVIRYGQEDGTKVAMGQVWTGMTEEMMRDSWGVPDSITVNNQNWGKYSQWYYGEITYFFKDGYLFEWESEENSNK